MRTLLCAIVLIGLFAPITAADDGTDTYIELLRSDLRADKKAIVGFGMDLTDQESKAFWPIYDAYEDERKTLGDRTLELITKYPDAVGVTGPDTIRMLSADWLKLQDDRVKLIKKYYKKAEKQLTPRIATRWMQIEYRMSLLINLQIASEIPLVEPIRK